MVVKAVWLASAGLMPDAVCDAVHRQTLRLAIEAAEQWGRSRPRRWSAHYGGIALARNAADLNAEFREHRKRIAALVPKIKVSPEWL